MGESSVDHVQLLNSLCFTLRSQSVQEKQDVVCKLVDSLCNTDQSGRNEERLSIMYELLDGCSPYERYRLEQHFENSVKRDFLMRLPIEISHDLLSFFDLDVLLTCCQVSKSWNNLISNDSRLWKKQLNHFGYRQLRTLGNCSDDNVSKVSNSTISPDSAQLQASDVEQDSELVLRFETSLLDAENDCVRPDAYKAMCRKYTRYLNGLSTGKSIDEIRLFGHSKRVTAIYYHNGRIATGSDDRTVRVWDCSSETCILCISAHSVAALKFDDHWLVTGSYDATAALWDVRTGARVRTYEGHVGCVFCIDYHAGLDRVVTGSINSTIMIFSFLSGQHLMTLNAYENTNWVTWISLSMDERDTGRIVNGSQGQNSNCYYVTISDGHSCEYWSIDRQRGEPSEHKVLYRADQGCMCLGLETVQTGCGAVVKLATRTYCDGSAMGCPDSNDHQLIKQHCFYVGQRPDNITTNDISCKERIEYVLQDVRNLSIDSSFSEIASEYFIKKRIDFSVYLGCEKRFSAFVGNEYLDNCGSYIYIIRRPTEEGVLSTDPVARIQIPSNFRESKRSSTITLGDREWMHGIGPDLAGKVLFAASLEDNSIHVVKFAEMSSD